MLNNASGFDKIYLATGYTDLRRGIDGLIAIIQQEFKLNPFQNILFLFCGKRTDRIKALLWEGDGFVLLYKRLESGKFQWPRTLYRSQKTGVLLIQSLVLSLVQLFIA